MLLKDRLTITTKREYTDEGFLIVPARISRTGIQEYLALEMGLTDRDPSDIINIFRPEEEVFSDVSLKSFANKPVTNNHPSELVTSKNSKEVSVGFSGPDVTKDGMFVKVILHITDQASIDSVENGKVELSNGYTSDIDWTAGVTPDGIQFDGIQRNIKGNHIALVEIGRAGTECRIADKLPPTGDTKPMPKITIDGVDFEVNDQAAQAIGKVQARLKDAENEINIKAEEVKDKDEEMEKKDKDAKKTEDALNAKIDDATSKIPTVDTIDILVTERKAVVDSVLKVCPDIEWKGKDADTLRKEVVAAKCPSVNMDSVTVDYITARFDMLAESIETNSQQNLDNAFAEQVKINDNTQDKRPADIIAREKMMVDSQNAWKGAKK